MNWQEIVEAIRVALQSQVAGGVFALSIVGGLWAFLRSVPHRVWGLARRRFIVTIDVLGNDPLFEWLTLWLNNHPYSKRSRLLTASSKGGYNEPVALNAPIADERPRVMFTPAPGSHLLWHNRRPVWLTRERKEVKDGGGWMGYQETITIRMFGRDATTARAILEEARDRATDGRRRVGVHVARWGDWTRVTEVLPRPLASVILPDGLLDSLLADATDFLEARDWYVERGIPWRRGYLFHGPPGSGKSSSIAAIAGHLALDLYIANVGDRAMSDEKLTALLLSVPERSAVLLEDVDALVKGREMQSDSGVTFAGLLNALDGVGSKPGMLTFLTTNHHDQLDPALIRKGRVDVDVPFADATAEQLHRLFRHFYGERATDTAAARFARALEGRSMAEAQAVLLDHKSEPDAAVRAASLRIA